MPEYPHTLPTWRFFPDGRALIVHTREEFDSLEPGHEDTPAKFTAPESPLADAPVVLSQDDPVEADDAPTPLFDDPDPPRRKRGRPPKVRL